MGVMISGQKLSKAMTHKSLFRDLDLAIEDGDRMGIIGPNGAGKSTLLKILVGLEATDDGLLAKRKGLKLAYVTQQPDLSYGETVLDLLVAAGEAEGLSHDAALLNAQKLASRLGFEDPSQAVAKLSGGWKKRLAIGASLMNDPDLVLFDEPTNHLDLRSVLWLEGFLREAPFAWVVVSHDRYFLDRTVKRILEINPMYPGCWRLDSGNYTVFMEKRDAYLQELLQREASLANKLRREDEWLVRQPKARGTKARYRIDAAMQMKSDLADIKQRLKTSSSDIDFQASGRKTKQLVLLKNVSKSFGERNLFKKLDWTLTPRMVLGILGDNGTGKSTLLKIIAGELEADEGERSTAPGLDIVYFDQGRESLNSEWTLKRTMSDGHDSVIFQGRPVHVNSWARRFQFRAEQLDQKVSMLSGGEQAKVLISRLMLRKADVLLLDEPNNDLDIDTLDILEESLEDFPGAIAIVSHDRYLLERLCTHFLAIGPQGSILAYADYEQWEKTLDDKPKKEKAAAAPASAPKARAPKAGKLSYNEQREFDRMEQSILEAETALEEAQAECEAVAADSRKLKEASDRLQAAQLKVEQLYERWTALETKLQGGEIQ